MTVERVRVGDVLELDRVPIEPQATERYVTIGVRSFGKGVFHYEEKPGDQLGKLRFFELKPRRLVVSNIKGWEGAVAVSTDADEGCIASSRFLTYRPVDDRIDVDWAKWFFLSDAGLRLIQRASPGSADRNRTLAIERFESLRIPLPEPDQQRRTADALGSLQRQVDAALHLIDQADRVASAVPSSLAVRPDLDDAARLRAGWRRLALRSAMSSSVEQVEVDFEGSYAIAGIYSFGRGLINRGIIRGRETSYKSFTRLVTGDVALSKLNGWEGAVAVVPPAFDGYHVSSEYPVFKINESVLLPGFFEGVARSPTFWAELDVKARGSMVRRRRINPAEFLSAEIWVPPIQDQLRVAQHIESAKSLTRLHHQRYGHVQALLGAALNRAFSGLA